MGADIWWVWLAAGLVLAIIEVLLPGYVFLGFAIGAATVGALLALGGVASGWFAGDAALTLALFAVLSLVAWLGLRRVVGVRKAQRKVWTRDINDD